jgi:hypothetical protein
MSITQYKKLPKGFTYPVSKKDVKTFINSYKNCRIDVEFRGLSSKQPKWLENVFPYFYCHPIHLSAYRNDEGLWYFIVMIEAENDEYMVDDNTVLSKYLISKIRTWIKCKINLLPHEPDGELRGMVSYKCSKENKNLIKE